MLKKILIANRGEIARRVIRTAQAMGIDTVAVYSEADKDSVYVREATESVCIGPPPATESYLSIENIISAAKLTGAEAIHPGYGFLSENADFADACEAANIIFIGPSAEVIRKMGSKESAKAIMAAGGVPVVPGADDNEDPTALKTAAQNIGLPILIKAVAGGGGRGMRLVRAIDEFDGALTSARREAESAFGNATVLLEKYIESPRHIEVQIFGDSHGNIIHAFERDCSTQRRYQKVIEEAPAANLTDAQRKHLHEAAVKAGKAVGYQGAGTVEFVMDPTGNIYFIEMNTRLQVEHPVTEAICGEDLVAWQLIIADGGHLPTQETITQSEHAIELRLCAEDPANNFAPSTGEITYLNYPNETPGVRMDTGIECGSSISPFYDSMFGKLIVTGKDRNDAINRSVRALAQVELGGLKTNSNFLKNILQHERFIDCNFDTHFVDDNQQLLTQESPLSEREHILSALVIFESENRKLGRGKCPWDTEMGFRLNIPYRRDIEFSFQDEIYTANVATLAGSNTRVVALGEKSFEIEVSSFCNDSVEVLFNQIRNRVNFHHSETALYLFGADRKLVLEKQTTNLEGLTEGGSGKLMAPMPGDILEVFVKAGQQVEAGTPLMLMEAMKIEHTISAPFSGTVTEVRFKQGDQITAEGVQLIVMEAAEI